MPIFHAEGVTGNSRGQSAKRGAPGIKSIFDPTLKGSHLIARCIARRIQRDTSSTGRATRLQTTFSDDGFSVIQYTA